MEYMVGVLFFILGWLFLYKISPKKMRPITWRIGLINAGILIIWQFVCYPYRWARIVQDLWSI